MRKLRPLTIWLLDEHKRALRNVARKKSIGTSTLIRLWVVEKLDEVRRRGTDGDEHKEQVAK